MREDQILPRLAALAIAHADGSCSPQGGNKSSSKVTMPGQAADLIGRLLAADVTFIYYSAVRALRADIRDSLAVTVGQGQPATHGIKNQEEGEPAGTALAAAGGQARVTLRSARKGRVIGY